jgi:glycosyltransferase involved in cell wall biosynthesis
LNEFSIVIPFFNEVNSIEKLLSHLKNSVLYKDTMEIIAVDGGSTDGSQEKIRRYPNNSIKERKSNTNECRCQSCNRKHPLFFTL